MVAKSDWLIDRRLTVVRWQVSATSDKKPRADNVNHAADDYNDDAVDDYNDDAEHDADSGDDAVLVIY